MAPSELVPSVADDPDHKQMTVYGRQGSPTVSIAMPFSKIEVNDDQRAMAAVAELAGLVARLADAAGSAAKAGRADELAAIAESARALLAGIRDD